ncbi:MAG: hypothetical protein AAF740_12460 [Bacteroidota bacterium]
MNIKTFFLLAAFLCLSDTILSQTDSLISRKERRKQRPTYFILSSGLSSGSFRDFATSPLVYSGIGLNSFGVRNRVDERRESELGLSYTLGGYSAGSSENTTTASVQTFRFFYRQLYQIRRFSSEKWNLKAGGQLNFAANIRQNFFLLNNSVGIEFFPTVFGSVKLTRDVSRKKEKRGKFLLFNYHLKPRKRELSFRFDAGLVNSTYRNGFVYIGQSFLLNEFDLFDGYEFKIFSGLRLNTALDYTRYLKNGNAMRWSYTWELFRTAQTPDRFEMGLHSIRFALLFNTKP